jgi:hypothetical protein
MPLPSMICVECWRAEKIVCLRRYLAFFWCDYMPTAMGFVSIHRCVKRSPDLLPKLFLSKCRSFLNGRFEAAKMYKTMAFSAGRWSVLAACRRSCISMAEFVQEFEWRLKEGDTPSQQRGGMGAGN